MVAGEIVSNEIVKYYRALSDRIEYVTPEPLISKGIAQVHKSYAVNVRKIKKVEVNQIISEGGRVIPLSKTFRERLLASMRTSEKSNV